ncbi:flavoprotein [Hypoxylon sp. FL1150]|nr:flavoprotein [Hypoxylon sp. FL1150]
MLQAISNKHDAHHERWRQNSLASLTASLRDNKTHLLLAASGSVATIKLPLIIQKLAADYRRLHPSNTDASSGPGLSIRVVLTPAASRFLAGQSHEQPPVSSLLGMDCVDGVYVDEDEWKEPWKRGDAILHIELRRWAHILAITPLSANTMAKLANGMSDGLLTSVVRAWDAYGNLDGDVAAVVDGTDGRRRHRLVDGTERARRRKRILVAPAMNTAMWRHPVTGRHLGVLEGQWGVRGGNGKGVGNNTTGGGGDAAGGGGEERRRNGEDEGDDNAEVGENTDGWFEVLRPKSKALACGDVGDGAMMEWSSIVDVIEERLGFGQ